MADVLVDKAEKFITEDELMALDEDARVEIIDGEVVDMNPVGGEHHDITGNVYDVLKPFVRTRKLGRVYMDGLIYLLGRKSRNLRGALVPDVSYIAKADIPADWDRKKPFPGAPTLAIEVLSPQDTIEIMDTKIKMYFAAGTRQVWVLKPATKEVHQYRAAEPGIIKVYTGDTPIDIADFLPGLVITADMCFADPDLSE
jgi:Uma2 family endonuclease